MDSQSFAIVLDDDLLKSLEILFDVGPLETDTASFKFSLQLLPEDQGEKAAERLSTDGIVALRVLGGLPGRQAHV